MTKTLVWFRQDLRINDNPALKAACATGEVVPVYIYDDTLPKKARLGGASKWWLHHALYDLSASFDNKLVVKKGNALDILKNLCSEHEATHIIFSRMYEPWARTRDDDIQNYFEDSAINVKSVNGSLLWEPWKVSKKDGTPYKVFTPYYRNGCLKQAEPRSPLPRPTIKLAVSLKNDAKKRIDALDLLPTINWDDKINQQWTVSEKAASTRLHWFINNAVKEYHDNRDLPAIRGTSQLSPYLHFGLMSPNQIWYAVKEAFNGNVSGKGVDGFLSELGWREFSYYLLYHFNDIQKRNFNDKFNSFPWRQSKKDLSAWQRGETGIPIVDAAMRELWQTGYMHNRMRMVTASFLVKNLLIDWREGERWFWDCLLDADTASNSAGWQWVAGCGADAAPFFRVFNPVLQGEKFDTDGEYVKRFCPELNTLPKKYIHKPFDAPSKVLQSAGVVLGETYPAPIIDLKASRKTALEAYDSIKGG